MCVGVWCLVMGHAAAACDDSMCVWAWCLVLGHVAAVGGSELQWRRWQIETDTFWTKKLELTIG